MVSSSGFSSLLLIASLCLSGVVSVRIVEQNHHEVTVKVDDEVNLVCSAETQAKACSFRDPTGHTFAIFEGARYDGGRITKNGDREVDCGIRISGVKDSDHGRWECSISALNEAGDLSVGTGYINVTVAVAPRAVSLMIDDAPVSSPLLRLRLDESGQKKIDCIAEASRPGPVFKWYIGGSELKADITRSEANLTPDGKADFTETLAYIADPNHNNQELRCVLEHMGYSQVQLEQKENIAGLTLELLFKPQQNPKEVQEFYELREGESNEIRMMFRANPKPQEGQWNINGVSVELGAESLDQKYKSSFTEDGDLPGEYSVTLTINSLQKEDVGRENELVITNDEGSTTYKFILEIGSKPPSASASGPIVGIVILVLILLALIGFAVFAKIKGLFCFAAKKKEEDTEKAVEKEGSDTESAEDNSPAVATEAPRTETGEPIESEDTTDTKEETAKRGPTVAARFSNLFAAVKKTVASKGTNAKDKYAATQDQGEADAKLNENDKHDDITYADIDTTALGPGTRTTESGAAEDEKTQYAEIKSPK